MYYRFPGTQMCMVTKLSFLDEATVPALTSGHLRLRFAREEHVAFAFAFAFAT